MDTEEMYKLEILPDVLLKYHPEFEVYYKQHIPVDWDNCKIETWVLVVAIIPNETSRFIERRSILSTLMFIGNDNKIYNLLNEKSINEQLIEFDKKMGVNHRYTDLFSMSNINDHSLIFQDFLEVDIKINTGKIIKQP
jgi:hypothetical protein